MKKMDKRIKKVTDIKTSFSEDFEELSNYIGFNVYGSDTVNGFYDLTNCYSGTLKRVDDDDSGFPFIISSSKEVHPFRYMILEKDLDPKNKTEKKHRPYTLKEFNDKFTVGRPIKFREKDREGCERYLILNGYMHEQREGQISTYIYIGSYPYTLDELFNAYEWQEHSYRGFAPFGVEE